jgi:hypothetical protein
MPEAVDYQIRPPTGIFADHRLHLLIAFDSASINRALG